MQWEDFQNLWEQRLLEVAEPYLDPAPKLLEGSAVAEFADESTLAVIITPQGEDPPHSGYWDCDILIQYDYERNDFPEEVSRTWGQILQAFGDGTDGNYPLIDRLRELPGRTVIPNGRDAIRYDKSISSDPEMIKQLEFSAHLGVLKQT